jgi:L-lactate dehydrogenase complex protein LldE
MTQRAVHERSGRVLCNAQAKVRRLPTMRPAPDTAPGDVSLFVPCYVDQLAPGVAEASLRVLERVGCRVHYDPDQTCCGQPFLNMGEGDAARRLADRHLERFASADVTVCPSGSCVATVRHRFREMGAVRSDAQARTASRTFELAEFLTQHLGLTDVGAHFPHRVGLLQSCHGLRDLGLGVPSEPAGGTLQSGGSTEAVLRAVSGLELCLPERSDECCGFGGAFSVEFPEISTRMGRHRLDALERSGAEYVTGTDVSCLMHLDGIRRWTGRGPRPIHLAEILATQAPA